MNANPAVSKIMSSVRYFVLFLLVLFLFIGSGIILGWVLLSRAGDEPSLVPSQVNLPSTEEDEEVELGNTAQKLTVNAQLQVNGRFYLAPSSLPEDAQPGTLVFDQSTSTLKYFNGSSFVSVTQQADVPEAGVTSLQGQTGAISLSPGAGISINGTVISSSGILGINGVAGDISVTTANGIASLSLPQSIATSASPTFSALTLNGNLTLTSSASIRANLIQQTTSGQDVTINAGSDDIFFTSGGRIFQFPGVAGSPQTICTTTSGCPGGGGGSFIELAPAAAQTDASANPTIFVNDTAGGNLIQLQAGGINRFVVANDGATTVGGSLTLGSALTVANGGTGVTSLTLNSVLVGNGTGAIQQVSTGTPNQCLVSTAGAPIFAACPGSGGVASIDGQTGTVTINNATGSGGVITLDDATTGAKGIASFSATNFSVASGVVNTIQGIATTSTPTFAGLTLSSPLAVTSGGTGAANASGARSNLGAAASGANSDISSTTALNTITPSAALSIGSTTQAFTIQGASTSVITAQNGSSVTTVGFVTPIASATINFPALAAGTYTICTTSGNCLGGAGGANTSLSNLSSIAINTSLLPGTTTIDLGSNANPFRDLFIGGSATNNLRVTGTATAARTITIPDATGTVCLSTGNCAGSGGGVTTAGGNTGRLSVFTGSQVLGDSWLLQNGSTLELDSGRNLSLLGGNLTVAGNAVITAGNTLQIVGGNTASRPASPIEGMVYYDTQTDQLLTYTGGKWQADRTDAVLVAAANSSQADKDIADYVADGNTGAANDGDQIQINTALTAASGRKVVLLAGTYVVDATVLIPNNTTLQGIGKGTLIELADLDANEEMLQNTDTATGSSVVIRDMTLDGRRDLNTAGNQRGILLTGIGSGISPNVLPGATVTGVTFTDFDQGIRLLTSDYNMVSQNIFTESTDAIAPNTSSYNSFIGNTFLENGNAFYFPNVFNYNTISGNVSRNTQYFMDAGGMTGNTISDNTITGADYQNIRISGNSTDRNTITGNFIDGGYAGIVVESGSAVISNNIVRNIQAEGINLYVSSGSIISNNRIENAGDLTDNLAIAIYNNSDNNSITDNIISDSSCTTTCIAIDLPNNTTDNTYIAGNRLLNGTINNLGTGTIFAGQTTSSATDFLFRGANSTTAFAVQNASGASILTIDTTNAEVEVGNGSTAGRLVISDGSSNTGTILVNATAGNYTFTIPTVTANDTFCLQGLANCTGSATTLQGAYDADVNGSDAVITLTSTDGAIVVRDAASTVGNLFVVEANGGSDYFAVSSTGIVLGINTTLAANQALTITGGNTASRPASPIEGMVYYDTQTDQLLTYTGGKWQADRTDAVLVAAANSSQADKDIADYVADGNTGAANDGDQIQINTALTAASGRKVVLLAGTYVVDASISLPSSTTLQGMGSATIITLPNSFNANITMMVNSDTVGGNSAISVRDLIVDGNRSNQSSGTMYGIYLDNVGTATTKGALLDSVTVKSMRYYGVFTDNASDIEIHSSSFSDFAFNDAILLGDPSTRIKINDNTVVGSIKSVSAVNNTNVQINGNTVTGSIEIQASDATIVNNVIGASSSTGIYVEGVGITVDGNSVTGSATHGIVTDGDQTIISNNTVSDNTQAGIVFYEAYRSTLSGNVVFNNGQHGIWAESVSSVITGNNVSNNGSSGAFHGIFVDYGSNHSIVGNYITDTAGTGHAIAIDTGISNTYLADNVYSGTGASTIQDLGTNTRYASQITPAQILQSGSSTFRANTASILTGSIDPIASTAVTGVGTLFTTELQVGDRITVSNETRTVTAISSDTSLTVDTAFSNNTNDTSVDRLPAGLIVKNSSGVNALSVNDMGTVRINTGSASTVGIIVQGSVSQSAYLMELRDSNNSFLGAFDGAGTYCVSTSLNICGGTYSTYGATGFTSVQSSGNMSALISQTSSFLQIGNGGTGNYGGVGILGPTGASNLGNNSLTVRGSSGQTGDVVSVQDSSGNPILAVDTAVTIGQSDTNATLLVLDSKTDAGDPAGGNGSIYYNSNAGKFRCYQAGAWTDCVGSGGGGLSGNLTDNTLNAWDIQEGTNNYINISTVNGAENISLGNTTNNPSVEILSNAKSSNQEGILTVSGSLTYPTASLSEAQYGIKSFITVQPSSAGSGFYYGSMFAPSATGANVSSATIVGVRGDGRTGSSSGTGTAVGGMFNVQNTGSGTLTIGRGIQVSDFINSGGGSITNRTGIAVAELTAGTNTTNLLIGTLNNPSGQFSVYNESTRNNVFRGNLRVGDTTAPTVALDVTGAGSFTSNLDVRGNTTLRTTTNSTNAFTVQNSASANILQVSTTNAGSITLFGNNSAELSAWSSANTLPGSRSDLVTVTAKGYAYAIGGWSTSAEDEVYRAVINSDGSLGTWSTTTSLPVGISNPAATVYGDYIYIVGGYDTATRNQVLYAKINNDGSLGAWTTSIQTIPVAGEYISGFAAKGYLFVLGGSSGGVPSSVVASAKINSNGSIDRFVTTTSIPQISANNYTESMGLAYSNGYVYLTGGSLGGCNTLTNNVRYAAVNSDGTLGSWTTSGNNLPANLEEHSVVVANGYIYALGGHTGGASCTNTVSNTYYAKLNTNGSVGAWSTATNNFTTARRTHGSLVANNFVYVVGGIDATSTALNTVRYTRLGGTLQIGGSIDLVGIQGGTLNETGTSISGSMGGSITAGNIKAVGVLEVQGAASIQGFTTLNGALVRDSLGVSSTGVHAFLVKNDTQTKSVLGVSTSTTYSTLMSGSFEDSMLNPWAAKNSGTVSITYADARFGFVSMQLVTGTAANNGAQYRYGFNESTQYTFSVWMRRSASSTSTIDIGRRDNATDTNCLTGQTVDTTWRRYSCTFTTGATIDPGAHVYIKQSDTTTDTIYIDGFSLVEGASSIDYTEPASTLQVNSADKIVSLFENEVPIPTRWQATTPFDNNISYTGFVTSRGYVYQLGGQDLSFNAYDSVKYAAVNANGSIGSWTTTSTLPETRVYHSALAANGHIYVLGGQDNWLSGAELDVYYAKVNPDGSLGAWASTTSIPGGGAMTYANGYIYILSDNGTTTYYAKVNTDGTLGAWNTNTALPVSVSYPAVTVANGYVYIAGGVVTGPSTTNVVRYAKIGNDGVLGAWNTASNLANGVVCASAVVSSGYIWVVGGTTVSNCNTGTGSYLQYAKINADGSLSPWGVTDIMGGDNINGNSVLVINNTLYVAGGDYDYSNGNTNAIFYAKFGGTLQVGGSIDLVGLGGSNIGTSGSSQGYGSVGGSITAGDGVFVGSMLVQGAATFNQSVNVSFDLVVGGSARFGGSIYLPDNNGLVLGNDNDASLGYDEAGEDRVELTGTNASLFIEDRLSFGVDARTIADNGAGTNATLTLNPNSSFVRITCSDAQGCDITMDEAVPVRDGNIVYIVNVSAVNVNFADTAGVSELGGAFAAGQYDSIQLIYSNDRWIETARSNN